jgi:uncharacterized membrane protein
MDTPAEGTAAPSRSANTITFLLLAVVVVVGAIFAFSGSTALPNDWYALFKAIHVTVATIWIGGGTLLAINGIRAQRESDPAKVMVVVQQAIFAGEKIFAPAGLVVVAMGIAMMVNTSWGWGHFWVVAGLIGFASTFLTGIGLLAPLARKIDAAAAEHGVNSPVTQALVDKTLLIVRVDLTVLLLVIVDMVTKPFA